MSQYALPVIAPGTVDLAAMSDKESTKQAISVLKRLNSALATNNAEMLENCFLARQAFWKDQLALTYHLRTFTTRSVITAGLLETKRLRGLTEISDIPGKTQFVQATRVLVSYFSIYLQLVSQEL